MCRADSGYNNRVFRNVAGASAVSESAGVRSETEQDRET
jgi:hypothetical protein